MTKLELKKFQTTLLSRQSELEGLIRNREAAAIETSADALDQIVGAIRTIERRLAALEDGAKPPTAQMDLPNRVR